MEQIKRKLQEDLKLFDPTAIKAVAIDIDGTLGMIIDHHTTCTERTEQAVKNLIKTGREVYLVTGRGTLTAMPFAKQLELPEYMINYNGGSIWSVQQQQRIQENYIDTSVASRLVNVLKNHDVLAFVYSNDDLYHEIDHPLLPVYLQRTRIQCYKAPLKELDPSSFLKLFIMGDEENILKLAEDVKRTFKAELSWFLTTPGLHNLANPDDPCLCLEIMSGGVNKGICLENLLKTQNISMEEVVAFGDDSNDIEMLDMVGWGIAMTNANDAVKKVARAETIANTDNGVAYFIEKYLL